ncbi:DUF3726 domain-containing protein [Methylocapsa sp. S129]|uniref:DUF3726 domain-containing protein n=1 Tax=Methylocapsa sp. S129 TaxID=1641869 RepID=UPI00131D3053|nr:DUF3726 domain-containing protein [Methylocapsa sp. S129]
MTELSLNEVESLAAKVGRGAGFSWGLAEEIGRGARRLAQGGFPWADALLALAEKAEAMQAPSPAQAEQWRVHRSETDSTTTLCPVRTAALLIDDPAILQAALMHLRNVGLPIWIVGVLAAPSAAGGFEVAWPTASAWVDRQGVMPKAPGGAWLTPAADVTISPGAAPSRETRPPRRTIVDDVVLTALGSFAARVNVPASESSRAMGAGGGSVDEE